MGTDSFAGVIPDLPVIDAGVRWQQLVARVDACRACPLGHSRQHAVFGTGNQTARWMLIGEAPGADEDRLGEPFVGRAGALLDTMLIAAGLDRGRDVYIANVLKCRPPGNRNPEPTEVARCSPHLREQVELVRPTLLVLMGRFAAQTLLGTEASIASLRGRIHQADVGGLKIPAVVSYHPAYLLRNPADKRLAWADWCLARSAISAALRQSGQPSQISAGSPDAGESPSPW
jgi:DNA polymerase